MANIDLHAPIRELRAGRLQAPAANLPDIEALIPHRRPFLLVDGLDGYDPDTATLAGFRHFHADDPLVAGHFPGRPVFPGSLQIEALAQLGACLLALCGSQVERSTLTRVHHAVFLHPVEPDVALRLVVRSYRADGVLALLGGQVQIGEKICAVAVLEALQYG